jgi:ABC-type polysaccharide/polyol phosphate export permease
LESTVPALESTEPALESAGESRLRRSLRLLLHLSWWDMVAQYFGSWIGLLWNFIMPATIILVYLAVFELSPGFRFGGHETVGGYGVNLVAALIPWLLFQEAVSRAANSFIDQRHLLTQVPVPPALYPLANVGSALVRHALALALFGAILWVAGIQPTLLWLGVLGVLPILLLITIGCALLAACFTTSHRDVAPAVGAAMLPLFFTTPVIYPPHIVPNTLRVIMDLNPITPIVVAYRDLMVTGRLPLFDGLLWSAAMGVVLCALGLVVMRNMGPHLAERVG